MSLNSSSTLIDTASITYTFQNIQSIDSQTWSKAFYAKKNRKLLFQLGIHPKPELDPTGVLICLWHGKATEPINLEYEVSILNERKDRCYTEYYQFNYDANKNENNFMMSNFIRYDDLINDENGFIPNDQLTLFCQVKIVKPHQSETQILENNPIILPKLNADFQSILTTGDYSDFVLAVGGKEFRVHKNILAARSSVFKAMFSTDLEVKKHNRLEIIDVDLEVFEQLLNYIYSGTVDKLDEYALELFVAADKYQLDELKSACAQSLASNLTVETVAYILLQSDIHNAPELVANCIQFITANSVNVIATDGWKDMVQSNRTELMAELYEALAKAHSALLL